MAHNGLSIKGRHYEREKLFLYQKKFLHQSQSSKCEPEPKKAKSLLQWHKHVDSTLVDMANEKIVPFSFYTISVRGKATLLLSLQRRY